MRRGSLVTRLLWLIGGAFAITSLAVMLLVMVQVRQLVHDSQVQVYGEHLREIMLILQRQVERLELTGQESVYEEDFKSSVLGTLRRIHYDQSESHVEPFILDDRGLVVLHPDRVRGDAGLAGSPQVRRLLAAPDGEFQEEVSGGEEVWVIHRTFRPWRWHVGFEIPVSQKFAVANAIQRTLVLVWIAVTLVVMAALAGLVARTARPILALTRASAAMAAGDLDHPIDIRGTDEVGVLARSFAGMRDAVHQKMSDLAAAVIELRESEARYRQIIDTITDGLLILDESGAIASANPAASRRYGYADGELLRRPLTRLFTAENHETATRIRAVGPNDVVSLTATTLRRDGAELQTEIAAAGLTFQGRPHVLVVLHDVTERYRLQGQLLQAQKMESVGRLAGGIAHDFNNLLSPILGYSEMLLQGDQLPETWREDLLEVQAAAERAKHLAGQMLAFGRKQALEFRTVDLCELVRGFESILRRTLRDDVELVVECARKSCPIRADSAQIEQILMNLAINAQDAMPGGGRLAVEVAGDPAEAPPPEVRSSGRFALLRVLDTGQGIPPNDLEHVFDPFFTTKEADRGTGLGLATVHGIVQQHGGSVRVASDPGRGTTFEIFLPRADGPAVPVVEPAAETTATGGHERVVLVEDNAMVRDLVGTILRKGGYEVVEFGDSQDCLEHLGAEVNAPDLLLTDVVMPRLNGPDLYRRLAEKHPGLKVVFMSGYTNDVLLPHGLTDDRADFLQKPVTSATVLRKIRDILDRPAPPPRD